MSCRFHKANKKISVIYTSITLNIELKRQKLDPIDVRSTTLTTQNVSLRQTYSSLEVKLQQSLAKTDKDINVISVIRSKVTCNSLIKQPGPASQHRMQVRDYAITIRRGL
jgi:hypothetical protein